MAIESITVQCYPSDSKINETVKRHEAFGWQLANNQSFQEFTGQTSDGDTITNHYSSYNKLTFSRETGRAWYKEVTALEEKHKEIIDEKEMYECFRPEKPKYFTKNILALFSILFIASFIGGFILIEMSGGLSMCLLALSPLLFIIVAIIRRAKYNKAYNGWFSSYYGKIQDLEKDAEKIRKQSYDIVFSDND